MPNPKRGLRVVAVIEALKGALVLFVGVGLPGLIQHRARHIVEKIVAHFHLNPAHHTPQVFLKLADHFDNTRLWLLATAASIYAAVRFAEAYGLWKARRWAEWLGCVGALMYVPVELWHYIRHPGWISLSILVANVAVVIYLAICLQKGVGKKSMLPEPIETVSLPK